MGILRDGYGDIRGCWIFLLGTGIIISVVLGIYAVTNILLCEGVETTVTGTIQLHQMKYNKVLNMEYTDMEMRTYSGDTHHIRLYGHHPELEYGKTYRIKFQRVNYWAHIILVNEVVEIVEI